MNSPFMRAIILILVIPCVLGIAAMSNAEGPGDKKGIALSSLFPESISDKLDMSEPDWIEHIFGPTDINGVVGNGRLTVGINKEGTVTVMKWPRPSFHDQVRYRTRSRDLPLMGARANDGVFLGLMYENPARTLWLRDADFIEQRYFSSDSNALLTIFQFDDEGLTVEVVDFVPAGVDALVRKVTVIMESVNAFEPAAVVAFANLAICRQKILYAPVADWLFDVFGVDTIIYEETMDLLMQTSTEHWRESVVASIGFFKPSISHQCGVDGIFGQGGIEAWRDALDGSLSGSGFAGGSVDGAVATALTFESDKAEAAFFISFGADDQSAGQGAVDLRTTGAQELFERTLLSHRNWIANTCLPDVEDSALLDVARRALFLAQVVIDAESGAIGSSVATQPPYSADWSRDGAYVNLMLDWAGLHDAAGAHNLFYVRTQRWPLGNWDMCVYGDGVPAGPLFLELDTFGLTAWTLWDHYQHLPWPDSAEYLEQVYGAIANAADFFLWWRNPLTKLPWPAFESDFVELKSTLLSAGAAWASMRYAIEAGREIGEAPDRIAKWETRRTELEQAIYRYYFDAENQIFLADPYTLAYMIYPFEFLPVDDERIQNSAQAIWEWLEPILNGETKGGSYLGLVMISLAKAWKGNEALYAQLAEALVFIVEELPTPGTLHYGECFVNLGDRFETRTGIPHPMTAALSYLTAAEMYGLSCPEADDDTGDDDDAGDDDVIDDDAGDDPAGGGNDDDDDDDGCGC